MAEVIPELPPRKQNRHPWDEWLDGQPRRLSRGADYVCDERVMADLAYNAARRRGMRVSVRYSRANGHVCLQAIGKR